MTKKNFIALADAIREHNRMLNFKTGTGLEHLRETSAFDANHLDTLAHFCKEQNSQFDMGRWLGYIAGTNGKNGGAIK